MRVADYIASFLISNGIRDIFMLTGNGAMYLNDAIAQSGIGFVCARNEAAAPMMAEAYAKFTGRLGAICVTSGPGSTNALPGLAEAWVDSDPIIVISGQAQVSHTSHNAKVPGLRTLGTAEIDIVPIVKPLTKYAAMISDPDSIRYHLEKAVYLATTERHGPVWLDIPMDVQYAIIDPETLPGYEPPPAKDYVLDIARDLNTVMDLLKNSKRPLLIGGHGIRQSRAVEKLRELVELAGIPIIFSRFAQDMMPHSHPLNFGQAGIKGSRYCASIMRSADLVISLGCRLAVQLVGHKFDAFDHAAKVIAVDIDPAELQKPGVRIDVPIHGDVGTFMEQLSGKLAQGEYSSWTEGVKDCQELREQHPMIQPDMQGNPMDLYYFMSRLDALSEENHVFVTDAGSNYYVGGQVYRFEKGQREITSGTFASMGLSIPLAIGCAVANKDIQVLAVTGDGSLELNIQELKTLSHYGLNVKLFVINNGGYVSMRNWQDGYFEGRRIDSAEETGVGTLNLEKIAAAFDLEYERIASYQEADDKIRKVVSHDRPVFVEVICDQNQKIVEPIKDLAFNVAHRQ